MRLPRRVAPALLAGFALSCGRAPRESAPAPPRPAAGLPRLEALPLAPGLVLALDPNLPGVEGVDVPESARREVEVLEYEKGRLRLRWSGRVRVEKPASARRREDWVRARANAPHGATPAAVPPAEYESRAVGGTLLFPDFATATEFLLPGLWPEGVATIAGTSALWISPNTFEELRAAGRATVPFSLSSSSLRDPAATLLKRAFQLSSDASSAPGNVWTRQEESDVPLLVDGVATRVRAVGARNWFGAYEISAAAGPPLVLSALPAPASSPGLDLFAPAGVLRTLLGYRVSEVTRAPRKAS